MASFVGIISALFLAFQSSEQINNLENCDPPDLMSAVRCLEQYLPEDTRITFSELDEDEVTAYTHHGLGMFLRNSWNMWSHTSGLPSQHSKIYVWFEQFGITHPDDMSGLILDAFWHKQNKCAFDFSAEVTKYHRYWDITPSAEQIAALDELPRPEEFGDLVGRFCERDRYWNYGRH